MKRSLVSAVHFMRQAGRKPPFYVVRFTMPHHKFHYLVDSGISKVVLHVDGYRVYEDLTFDLSAGWAYDITPVLDDVVADEGQPDVEIEGAGRERSRSPVPMSEETAASVEPAN